MNRQVYLGGMTTRDDRTRRPRTIGPMQRPTVVLKYPANHRRNDLSSYGYKQYNTRVTGEDKENKDADEEGRRRWGPRYKTKPCPNFLMGRCQFGNTCRFIHDEDRSDRRRVSKAPKGSPPPLIEGEPYTVIVNNAAPQGSLEQTENEELIKITAHMEENEDDRQEVSSKDKEAMDSEERETGEIREGSQSEDGEKKTREDERRRTEETERRKREDDGRKKENERSDRDKNDKEETREQEKKNGEDKDKGEKPEKDKDKEKKNDKEKKKDKEKKTSADSLERERERKRQEKEKEHKREIATERERQRDRDRRRGGHDNNSSSTTSVREPYWHRYNKTKRDYIPRRPIDRPSSLHHHDQQHNRATRRSLSPPARATTTRSELKHSGDTHPHPHNHSTSLPSSSSTRGNQDWDRHRTTSRDRDVGVSTGREDRSLSMDRDKYRDRVRDRDRDKDWYQDRKRALLSGREGRVTDRDASKGREDREKEKEKERDRTDKENDKGHYNKRELPPAPILPVRPASIPSSIPSSSSYTFATPSPRYAPSSPSSLLPRMDAKMSPSDSSSQSSPSLPRPIFDVAVLGLHSQPNPHPYPPSDEVQKDEVHSGGLMPMFLDLNRTSSTTEISPSFPSITTSTTSSSSSSSTGANRKVLTLFGREILVNDEQVPSQDGAGDDGDWRREEEAGANGHHPSSMWTWTAASPSPSPSPSKGGVFGREQKTPAKENENEKEKERERDWVYGLDEEEEEEENKDGGDDERDGDYDENEEGEDEEDDVVVKEYATRAEQRGGRGGGDDEEEEDDDKGPRDKRDERWAVMFGRLQEFERVHGHCNVPKWYPGGLGTWATTQRAMKTRGKMPREHEEKLQVLGYSFQKVRTQEKMWKVMYEKLKQYQGTDGAFTAPECNKQMATWLHRQRRMAETDELSPEKRELLQAIGAIGDIVGRRKGNGKRPLSMKSEASKGGGGGQNIKRAKVLRSWEARFEDLRRFKEAHGHCKVTARDDPSLSTWLSHQRGAWRRGTLKKQRVKLLQGLGWLNHIGIRSPAVVAQSSSPEFVNGEDEGSDEEEGEEDEDEDEEEEEDGEDEDEDEEEGEDGDRNGIDRDIDPMNENTTFKRGEFLSVHCTEEVFWLCQVRTDVGAGGLEEGVPIWYLTNNTTGSENVYTYEENGETTVNRRNMIMKVSLEPLEDRRYRLAEGVRTRILQLVMQQMKEKERIQRERERKRKRQEEEMDNNHTQGREPNNKRLKQTRQGKG